MRPSLLSPLVPKWGNEAFLNQALSLTLESKLPTSVEAICHWRVMSSSCKSSPGILVMKINLDIMKAGYGKSFVLACVASGLFSEMEKKKAAKRREMVPLPFHWTVCHASLRDRCPTSRPSHNPKRKASYARLFLFTFIDQLIAQVCTG